MREGPNRNPLEDPALAELLAAERAAPDPGTPVHDRVWQRVSASVALPLAPPPADGGLSTVAAAKGGLAVKLGVSAGLVVGGGGLVVALAPDAPTEAVDPSHAPAKTRSETHAPPELAFDAPPTGAAALDHALDHALAAERALLGTATAAVRARALTQATEALTRHAAEFPDGRLREERDALAIRVQLLAGQRDQARDALDRFTRRYPHSPQRARLEAALARD